MTVFYWVMGVLVVGTLLPALLFLLLYVFSGDDRALRRAQRLWALTRMFTLLTFNLLVWGHVLVGLWNIWRH